MMMCLRVHLIRKGNQIGSVWKSNQRTGVRSFTHFREDTIARVLVNSPQPKKLSSTSTTPQTLKQLATVPNLLCVGRIALSPVIANLITNGSFKTAVVLFAVAGVSDLLDGIIARKFPSQASSLGSFLDPLADKVLVISVFGSLCLSNALPIELGALVISRDILLLFGGSYVRYISIPKPVTLQKFFDARLSLAQVAPSGISKMNTFAQFTLIGTALVSNSFYELPPSLLNAICIVTGVSTVVSAVDYAFNQTVYKFSQKKYESHTGKRLIALATFFGFNTLFMLYQYNKRKS